jgi:threonine/homoserine/homoserine lactone efflux protein
MTPTILAASAIAGATYTLIPGPAFLALLGIGASRGRRAATGFIAGHFAGDVLWSSLALVAIIGAHSFGRQAFDILGLLCGAYLCWLGINALRARRDNQGKLVAEPKRPLLRGLVFGLTNPKGYPVALAMFTALLSTSSASLSWSAFPPLLAAAALGFIIADLILIAFVGMGVVRRLYQRYDIWVARVSGLLFIGFGLHALYESASGLFARRP